MFQSYVGKDKTDPNKGNPMPNPTESAMALFMASLGSIGTIWNSLKYTQHSALGKIEFFIFIMVVTVLLVNLLIAMMGNTYTVIAEIKNEWMRQWARTVLIVERGISPKTRLKKQSGYCEYMADGTKALVLKQVFSVLH